MKPGDIEALSFRIIDAEAGDHGFCERRWQIVRRMIHTSADFEYLQTVRFHPGAIDAGLAAIRAGADIVTDTRMALAGIRKTDLARHGGRVHCLIDDPVVGQAAAANGTTRAREAVDAAADRLAGGIFAVGNAPTALMRLLELVDAGRAAPALVIGLPVGFVNAAESKAALARRENLPYITNTGRKGGSNLAAAVINALLLLGDNR
jgi:precorrin-8X/cobalt-precorrin-8 methylmutase